MLNLNNHNYPLLLPLCVKSRNAVICGLRFVYIDMKSDEYNLCETKLFNIQPLQNVIHFIIISKVSVWQLSSEWQSVFRLHEAQRRINFKPIDNFILSECIQHELQQQLDNTFQFLLIPSSNVSRNIYIFYYVNSITINHYRLKSPVQKYSAC